jgi:hypothetical protein
LDVVIPVVLAVIIGGGTLLTFLYLASKFPLDDQHH